MFVSSRWVVKESPALGSPVPGAFWIPSSWELQKGVVAAGSVQCCQFFPCKSCLFLSVQCWSCSKAPSSLLWGSLLGAPSSQCSCSLRAPLGAAWSGRVCAPRPCRLAFHPPLARVFTLGLQTELSRARRVLLLLLCQKAEGFGEMLVPSFLAELSEAWTPLWNQTFWCFWWATWWFWFIYFTIRQSPLITSLSWGQEWEAARHGDPFSAVGTSWCCVGITICTEASLWYKPHPLLFLIRSSWKYNILLVGETKEGILLGYRIKVPSIMLLC